MKTTPQKDWLGVGMQIVFGMLVGAVLGFGAWVHRNQRHPDATALAWRVALGAIVVGALAGRWGDRLWLGADEGLLTWRRPRGRGSDPGKGA